MDRSLDRTTAAPLPARRTISTYQSYDEAQRAIDRLAGKEFPIERTAIVAEGISFVEQVTGRSGWAQALLSGALSGAVIGAIFGFIFGLLDWVEPLLAGLTLALYGLVFGAIIGAGLSLLFYLLASRGRDFTSVSGLRADRYTVVADDEVAEQARRLLLPA